MPQKTSRQIQAENTKAHILSVVRLLLQHKTFDELTIQDICKEANVSVGAFYHHFENKSGIVIKLYKDIDLFFTTEVLNFVIDKEPIEAIVLYLLNQVEYALNTGKDLVKNIYKAQMDNGNTFFISNERGLPEGLKRLINRAIDQNKIKSNVSSELLTEEMLIITRGIIYYWCVNDEDIDILNYSKNIITNYIKSFQV